MCIIIHTVVYLYSNVEKQLQRQEKAQCFQAGQLVGLKYCSVDARQLVSQLAT